MAMWHLPINEFWGKSSKMATTSRAFSAEGWSMLHQSMSPTPTPSCSAVEREMMTLCARFSS